MIVFLLHGFTMSLDMWSHSGIAESLSNDYRVITIDLRGHGKREKPTNPKDYGPKISEDVVNLLNHLNIANAHFIGYSMGAFVTGRLLITHPGRIYSATLVSGSFPVSNKEEIQFSENVAIDMEERGDIHLASVARGWSYDSVSAEQISKVIIPMQAVFGSEEQGENYSNQKKLLEMPESSRPVIIIQGADHDSEKAAVLHPKLLTTARELINSVKP